MIAHTDIFPMQENEIGAAARRKCQAILGEIFWPMQLSCIAENFSKSPMHVINTSGGSGVSAVGLLHMLNEDSTLTVFEPDVVNIELLKQKISSVQYNSSLEIHNHGFTNSSLQSKVDLIAGASVLNTLSQNLEIIQKALTYLTSGGLLVLSFVDLSKSQAYPNSSALHQYREYLDVYQEKLGLDLTPSIGKSLCDPETWSLFSIETRVPTFLVQEQRQLPSLILEYLMSELSRLEIVSLREIQALLTELRYLASHHDSLISGPLVFQLIARKK